MIGQTVAKAASVKCSFIGPAYGEANSTVVDIVKACATTTGGEGCGQDDASVAIQAASVAPSLNKSVKSWTMDVTYKVTVLNNSSVYELYITSLTDNVFGDIGTGASGAPMCVGEDGTTLIGDTIAASTSVFCTFEGTISNTSPQPHNNTVTVGVKDSFGNDLTANGSATVTVTTTSP